MRVAIVQEHVDVRRGGAETSTLEMARRLGELNLDVTVVCAATPQREDTPNSAVRLHEVPVVGASRFRRTVRFILEADRYCRLEQFDIVHAVTPCFSANVYQPRGGTYVETIARSIARARTPLDRWLKRVGRRFNKRQRFLLLTERELLTGREPPFVAAVSDYVRRQVEDAFELGPERVRVVFNGVEFEPLKPEKAAAERTSFRAQREIPESAPVVLFVAHNFKLKGLSELIRATACGESDWTVVVAGRDEPSRYARLAKRLGVAGRVHFVGAQTPVEDLYASADVLAHPTWYDPCSRVVLEALSAGLPVVTTRFNGAAEVMEPGRHGEVIESPDAIDSLARAITNCTRPHARSACAADAAALRQQLSMTRHARELRELYETVLCAR